LQVGGCSPGTFVGVDLKHSYLADLARDRLGLLALARWEQARDGGDWTEAVVEAAGDNGGGQMSLLEAMGRECSPNA